MPQTLVIEQKLDQETIAMLRKVFQEEIKAAREDELSKQHLTRKDLMEKYSCSKQTTINWEHRGLKFEVIGGRHYYKVSDLENFKKKK